MTKVISQHNGIKLIEKEDGTQMYYSTHSNKTALGARMLARLLDCHPQTIENIGVKLDCFKHAQLPTAQGVQGVNFITEDKIPDVLEHIAKSKMKKETKTNAAKFSKKLTQAGFRLMVLLEVAPELVAKEAIDSIKTPEQAEKVAHDAGLHAQYLRSHIAINYEAEKNELKAGKIVGENNEAVGLPYRGGRGKATNIQKSTLTSTQLGQSAALNKMRKSDKDYEADTKYQVCDSIRQAHAKLMKSVDELIDSL